MSSTIQGSNRAAIFEQVRAYDRVIQPVHRAHAELVQAIQGGAFPEGTLHALEELSQALTALREPQAALVRAVSPDAKVIDGAKALESALQGNARARELGVGRVKAEVGQRPDGTIGDLVIVEFSALWHQGDAMNALAQQAASAIPALAGVSVESRSTNPFEAMGG